MAKIARYYSFMFSQCEVRVSASMSRPCSVSDDVNTAQADLWLVSAVPGWPLIGYFLSIMSPVISISDFPCDCQAWPLATLCRHTPDIDRGVHPGLETFIATDKIKQNNKHIV